MVIDDVGLRPADAARQHGSRICTATIACVGFILCIPEAKAHGSIVSPVESDEADPDWLKGKELRATYSGGIDLIFEHRCVPCHRPGEVAPMSFLTYNEIRHWASRTNTPLESLIQTRAMPPWPADPGVGAFSNSFHLTSRELDLMLEWIRRGFPRGEAQTNTSREWVEGWNIGMPDHIFELPKYTVPAGREIDFKEFVLETNFPEDRWISASEIRPGDSSVVARVDAGPLGSYHPGNGYVNHRSGMGTLIRAGQQVVVRIQYEKGASVPATDASRIGVRWSTGPARRQAIMEDRMRAGPFTIPAGSENFEVTARFQFQSAGEIIALMPIMNLRGKDVRYRAILPDGSEKSLLAIPSWDPNWKFRYQLQSPFIAPEGTVVEAIAHFDNSDGNIRNPDPTVAVASSPETELFEGWISYTLPDTNVSLQPSAFSLQLSAVSF